MRSTIFALVLLVVGDGLAEERSPSSAFTLDDFLKGTFADKKWNGNWYDDSSVLYRGSEGYELFHLATVRRSTLISKKRLENYSRETITFSQDKRFALIKYDAVPVYRHSSLAKFALLKMPHAKVVQLPVGFHDSRIQTCRFAQLEDALIAVKDNNIYYITNLATTPTSRQVTTDGKMDVVYNGVPDWIYEEEVIGGDSALWTTALTNKFIYAKFDDNQVKSFVYPKYGEPGAIEDQYPTMIDIKYPKAGQRNPKFSLHSYDPTTRTTVDLKLGFEPAKDSIDYVVFDVVWWTADAVVVSYTNREQNHGYLKRCDVNTGTCTKLSEQIEDNGWLDVQPVYVLNSSHVVETYVANESDTFRVLDTNKIVRTLDLGSMTASKIYGHLNGVLYFEATPAEHHARQHVYSVQLDGTSPVNCVTCDFRTFDGYCTHSRAEFSPGMVYMTRICAGPGPAYADIVEFPNATGAPHVWLDNAELRSALGQRTMPMVRDLKMGIPGTKYEAVVRLLVPPEVASGGDGGATRYPMLVNVYAGPNSNQISDVYAVGLQHYMVTNRKYVYAYIDARGSGKRGRSLTRTVYKQLGRYEVDDQITITKKLCDQFDFINKDRIGIWGWSYGGFAAAHAIARDNGTFQCGVSVAPVTDFIYYDSIYTERYMGVYDDANATVRAAYEGTDVTRLADNFKAKNFLLVHGSADDNVHYQQAMLLARALEKADVPFVQMSYPDEAHSLSGVKPHLYHMLDAFWLEHLGEPIINSSADAALPRQTAAVVMLITILVILL